MPPTIPSPSATPRERRVPIAEPGGAQSLGQHALSALQHRGALGAERQAQGEARHGDDRGTTQDLAERLRKLAIGDRIGRRHVDRSGQRLGGERERDGGEDVVHRDPADVLVAAADVAAEAEPERRQHLRERAAGRGEDDAESQVHDANARARRRAGRRFPLARHVREKVLARRAVLGEHLVAAVAIVPDRRRGEQRARPAVQPSEGVADDLRAEDAAVADAILLGGRPPPEYVLTGEVNDGAGTFEGRAIDRPAGGVPLNRALAGRRRTAHERYDLMAGACEQGLQRGAEETRGPAHHDSHSGRIASASISTSMAGSTSRVTATRVLAGRIAPNTSPWARPIASQ